MTAFHLVNQPDFPHTGNYVGSQWIRFTVPFTSTLVLGSAMSCIISRLRGNKDDSFNYFFGFLTTAPIWTAVNRNSGTGTAVAVAFALMAVALKIHDQRDANVAQFPPDGRSYTSGSFGGVNAGDLRWLTPSLIYRDPGRRPPSV